MPHDGEDDARGRFDAGAMRFRSVLLAAGSGTRLRPLTLTVPKAAVPLLDVPLAAFSLGPLSALGPVVVNASYLSDELELRLDAFVRACSAEIVVERPEPFGTAGTLRALRDRLDDVFVTHNADTLTDLDFTRLLDAHDRLGTPATAVVRRVVRGADFELRDEGPRLVDRRTHPHAAGARFVGTAIYDRSVLDDVSDHRPLDAASALLGPLAASGRLGLVFEDTARDVGTVAAYLAASLDVLAGRVRVPFDPPGDIVEVPGGRAYVGPGADHSDGELGAGAILLRDASLGRGASVRDAIVWPCERVADGVVVERAVWAGGQALAAVEPDPRVRS